MHRLIIAAALIATAFAASAEDQPNPMLPGGSWDDLRYDIAQDAELKDGSALFDVAAPYRAHDAAIVPVTITQIDPDAPRIERVMLVIDENPAPLAATITFGAAMHPLDFETRIRVNQYSNVRVLADTATGTYMNGRFVKASGGCSAPATKDPAQALATMGQMRLKLFGDPAVQQSVARREAQVMIRHPNYSGLQRDQITQLFVSAHFISALEVRQGDDVLFSLEGGISISENPVFRFWYSDNGSPALTVRAVDTDGNVFQQDLPKMPPA